MSKKPLTLSIKDGVVTMIYDDSFLPLMLLFGKSTIRRASFVEACENGSGWEARLENGPVLGPYPTRAEALGAEVDYLERKMFG